MASSDPESKRLELEKLVHNFRIDELKKLLEAFKKRKSGSKPALMARALELINESPSPPGLELKINQLYKAMPIKGWFPTKQSPLNDDFVKTLAGGRARLLGATPSGSNSSRFVTPRPLTADTKSPCTVGDIQPVIPSSCAGVKMKGLPFYEDLSVIRKPTILDPTKKNDEVIFQLKIHQLREILKPNGEKDPQVGVTIRFCTFDSTTTSEQPDHFPEALNLKVNGRPLVNLPIPEHIPKQPPPKRPSYPVHISSTFLSIHSANVIQLSWNPEPGKSYCCSVYLTRKLSVETLLGRLIAKPLQVAQVSKDLIKKSGDVDGDDLCVLTSVRVSLACPYTAIRMKYPCRGLNCTHLQCFDAKTFLQIHAKMTKFSCPVCNTQLKFNDLCLDGYFSDVLNNLPKEAGKEVKLFPGGAWLPCPPESSKKRGSGCDGDPEPPSKKMKSTGSPEDDGMNKTIDLADEDSEEVAEQISQMPTVSIFSSNPAPFPYSALNENPVKCYDAGAGAAVEVEPKVGGFVDSFKNGMGLGKENQVYWELD